MTSITSSSENFGARVMHAVMWRSGSQLIAQLVMWSSTFFVIRLLTPSDYGLFAMTQSVLVMFSLLNGWGFTSSLIRAETIDHREVRQVFGMLLLLNGGIALVQFLGAPLAAAYYHQPIVAQLLRVQSLLYLATPFIALPAALLSRKMDFRRQATVDLVSAAVGAATALGCALAHFGPWTLVIAPIALFWTRAIGLTIAARLLVMPSFRFAGAGEIARFGGAMIISQFFWFIQTQADVLIGGRALDPHRLGLYTTSLFLAQIMASKFIPPLNDIAYTAYARLQNDPAAIARSFEKAAGIIMLLALPFYLGLAVTAEPLIMTILGDKWAEAVPIVRILALAMPFMTLQILFAPAATAMGRPRVQVYSNIAGALIMPAAFLYGVQFGPTGLAWAWLGAFPLLAVLTAALAMPVIGVRIGRLSRAIAPAAVASVLMTAIVFAADRVLVIPAPPLRLAVLVGIGSTAYGLTCLAVARPLLIEILRLVKRRTGSA